LLDTRPAPNAVRGAQRSIRPTGVERTFSADELIVSKTDPSTEVGTARNTIASLTRSSAEIKEIKEIKEIIALIDAVAAQTRLLALNATIEAARAGEAGKGFAVVASEVKDLADQTGRATERVTAQVEEIRQASEAVAAGMGTVGTTVDEMNGLVDGIAAAVDGSSSLATGGDDITGLSQMAERLRSEATGFLAEMRR
jgi:methyl-accepting chemotaxis protein